MAITWQRHGTNSVYNDAYFATAFPTRTLDVDHCMYNPTPHESSTHSSILFPLRCVRGELDSVPPYAILPPAEQRGGKSRLQPTSRLRPRVQSFFSL